jgi:hypothetical protein
VWRRLYAWRQNWRGALADMAPRAETSFGRSDKKLKTKNRGQIFCPLFFRLASLLWKLSYLIFRPTAQTFSPRQRRLNVVGFNPR